MFGQALMPRAVAIALLAGSVLAAGAQQNTFDVAAIKPAGEAGNAQQFGEGCDGGFPKVENHRFAVTTTVYALITWAYGFNAHGGCSYVNYGGLLSGGPRWVKTERFTIQAVMPETAPAYTMPQFLNGAAPELDSMIRTLLQDRFKLVLHRETKQVSGYALVRGSGASTIARAKADDREAFFTRNVLSGDGQVTAHLTASKTTMRYVALMLGLATRRMIEDRTGLDGEYTFELEYAPLDAAAGQSSAPSIFTAVQELGLKLESARVTAEGLVIDSIARPSEN